MQARYYDPVIGRFYSNDPVGFRDVHSFNRYAYVANNPYKYTDPTGMTMECANDNKQCTSTQSLADIEKEERDRIRYERWKAGRLYNEYAVAREIAVNGADVWSYSQSSGVMNGPNGEVYQGYSGSNPDGINKPSMQSVSDVGPIPAGYYWIGTMNNVITKVSIELIPLRGTNMYGRFGMRIHGGNKTRTASKGCPIIDGVSKRRNIYRSKGGFLLVY
jgi:uncharacterized protein RhaS with RHS repeats